MNDHLDRRLRRLELTQWALLALVATLLVDLAVRLAPGALPQQVQAALADRATLVDPAARKNCFYFSTLELPAGLRDQAARVLAFTNASASPEQILDHQRPVQVTPTLWRVDVRALGWSRHDLAHVAKGYPYRAVPFSLVCRADWWIRPVLDAAATDAYYRLLYGRGQIPRTRDEFLAHWNVAPDPIYQVGQVEGASRVSQTGIRWVENRPTPRGYAWGTRDVREIKRGADPLAALAGEFVHDGEEWIVGIPKIHLASGQRSTAQVYLLTDGRGAKIDKADGDLVEDHTRFLGLPQIRTAGSCIQCHRLGIKPLHVNALARLIVAGVDVYADHPDQESLERFHLAQLAGWIARNQQDYAAFTQTVAGYRPATCSRAVRALVNYYVAPVTIERAALELASTPAELQLALGWASGQGAQMGPRLPGLAHGVPLPRTAWEDDYTTAAAALAVWRTRG